VTSARRDLALACMTTVVVLAALFSMSHVFTADTWVAPSVIAAVAASVMATGARRVGLGALASLILTVVGFIVYSYVAHLPPGPLIPGREQLMQMYELFGAGLVGLREQPAPTEPLEELVFLVSSAAWMVAFTVHEVAVRLHRPGASLVPATALWVAPLAMPQPEPAGARTAVGFLLAAALLLLLESDADLVGWARERIAPRITLAGTGLAVGAVALGVVAPGLLPGYQAAPLLELGTGSDPRGYQPIVDIGDRLNLPVDRTVMRVASDRRVYLRLAALDTFDENTWRLGPPGGASFTPDQSELYAGDRELPFETAIAAADTTVIDIEIVDLENIYVPVPYQPVQIIGDAAREMVWSRVGGFLATGELSENELGGTLRTGVVPGLQYQVVAAIPDPTIAELRTVDADLSVIAPWLDLPGLSDGRWDRYADQARTVYDQTGAATAVDRALALQYWFTTSGGFEYSLTDVEPLRGPNPLEAFVFETKTGYCEYYATAMALMLRATGIPARVAVGFLPGTMTIAADPAAGIDRDIYEVSTSDAHAWVEVLFDGYGWIKFDPTPRTDGSTLAPVEDDLDPQLTPEELADAQQLAALDGVATTNPLDELNGLPDDTTSLDDEPDSTTDTEPAGVPLLPMMASVIGLACLMLVRRRRGADDRQLAGAEAALAAQRRVLREGARIGHPRLEHETAREVLHRWASENRIPAPEAATLALITRQAAFGLSLPDKDAEHARALADSLVRSLRATATQPERALSPVRIPITQLMHVAARVREAGRSRLGE
jgi:transglutaminase-like putative cysteine protease